MPEVPEFPEHPALPPEIDTSRPHAARMYDYFLGGKNHFAADRETADKVIAAMPGVRTGPRENRAFLGRAVRYLAAEAGIRQFLDIGTGLPTTNSIRKCRALARHDIPGYFMICGSNEVRWSDGGYGATCMKSYD
jgi:S-adenosyl methyltransferase